MAPPLGRVQPPQGQGRDRHLHQEGRDRAHQGAGKDQRE
jgi:hypothetical protein